MSKTRDPRTLVEAIKRKIDAIVSGNNPLELPAEFGTASAHDQTFDVLLGVSWSWRSEWKKVKGATNPSGSIEVANCDAGNHLLEKLAHDQAANERYVDRLLAGIAADPTAATAFGNSLLAGVSGTAHFHEACTQCHGSSQVPCGCGNGKVICNSCLGHGRGGCPNCLATGTVTVYVQEYNSTNNYTITVPKQQACPWCLASGKYGNCTICEGAGSVACSRCGGTARIECRSCGATGWFTHLGTAEIHSSIERSLKIPAEAPPTFAAYLTDNGPDWCRDNADYVLGRSVNANGRVWVTIAGTAPYANQSFVVAAQGFSAEAFGTRAEVAVFPPFLDPLLKETVEAIKRPRAEVADWFGAVQHSRLLKQLFDHISDGDKEAVEAAYRLSHGAASRDLLTGAEAAIKAGVKRVGRKAINRTWLIGLLVAVLAVPLVAAADFWGRLAVSAHLSMAQSLWAIALGPLAVLLPTWLTAHLLWRREAKMAFLGKVPAHGPLQLGRLIPLTILLAACNVGAVDSLYARGRATATHMGYGHRLGEMEHNAASFISTVNADRLAKLWDEAFSAPIEQPQATATPSSPTSVKAKKKPRATRNASSRNSSAPVSAPSVATAITPSVATDPSPSLPETLAAQSPDANANVQSVRTVLLGTWRGTYMCGQGKSMAELVISDVTDQGELHGTFHFFSMPHQHTTAPGEYTVSATYQASGFSFTPVKWVLAPPGYSMVGFNVRLENDTKLIGRITSSGCQGISLEK